MTAALWGCCRFCGCCCGVGLRTGVPWLLATSAGPFGVPGCKSRADGGGDSSGLPPLGIEVLPVELVAGRPDDPVAYPVPRDQSAERMPPAPYARGSLAECGAPRCSGDRCGVTALPEQTEGPPGEGGGGAGSLAPHDPQGPAAQDATG
mmetsp:Transcript_29522/g.47430  ORF Transcript_29522/g.47430 Transcript_29522/m.47430 type:complete len:149 (+) Transcript_29522:271-717(+)